MVDLQGSPQDTSRGDDNALNSESDSLYSSRKQSSSFSFPSPATPAYPQLSYSVSSPALPYIPAEAIDSTLAGKYRPCTKSPSDGADVRWYFCKTPLGPNEAAASVPAAEVVGKGEYFRFSISDSATLEAAFLEREEDLVSAWWKEYAECREGPSASSFNSSVQSALRTNSENSIVKKSSDFTSRSSRSSLSPLEEDKNVGVLVKGGLYEVDLRQRRCSPVYWRGDHRRVLRGHWFERKGGLDWLPIREDIAEQLEIAYKSQIWRRRRFQPSGLFAARVNLHGATEGLHALFTGEDDTWEAWLSVDATRISSVLGLSGGGVRLRRGFLLPESAQPTQDELRQRKEEEMDDYASKVPVRHVVFMVHGIGQRLEKANLVDDVGTFRHTVSMLAEQHLTQYQRNCQRVLFIPCQWRRGLKLGGESAVEDCTLEGVRALRTMLSATVHDVLYYMSPVYCQDIIDSVSSSLNGLYGKFIKRNPNYDGKVSIYGHSLGSVLSYDILCHQETLISPFPVAEVRPTSSGIPETSNEAETENGLSLSKHFDKSPSGGVSQQTLSDISEECDTSTIDTDGETSGSSDQLSAPVSITESAQVDELCSEADNHASKVDTLVHDPINKSSKVELTEVEALKAEVKLLREKLVALEQQSSERKTIVSEASPAGVTMPMILPEKLNTEEQANPNSDVGAEEVVSESSPDTKEGQLDSKSSSKKHYTPYISYTKLDFKVDTFYAVGSPLGVFLSLRNIRLGVGMGQEYWQDEGVEEEMPAVRQMMNIFHPYDPVAYRIEPLVCREFVEKRPTFIPYHKGGKRLHIGMQEFSDDLTARSKAIVDSLSSVGARMAGAFIRSPTEKKGDQDEIDVGEKERTYGQLMMERLTGTPDGRIDYQLQDATFEHQYISVISSHTSYWHDLDTALFILKHLYKDIPDEPPPINLHPEETGQETVGTENGGLRAISQESEVPDFTNPEEAGQIHRPEDDLDDLSLTFSGKAGIAAIIAEAKAVKPGWKG